MTESESAVFPAPPKQEMKMSASSPTLRSPRPRRNKSPQKENEANAFSADEVFFGEQPPGSLKIPFGDQEDPDEMAGAYWFLEERNAASDDLGKRSEINHEDEDNTPQESLFRLVGSYIRQGTHIEQRWMRDVVALGPVLPISELQMLDLGFAETMSRPATADRESLRRLSGRDIDLAPEIIARDPFFVQIGDRLVDVDASLRHVYREKSDHTGQVRREDFADLLRALDLELAEDELAEALLPFPEEYIRFAAFREWWMG
ncbi:Hypothetical Protein FCC1311_014292 [Hondaea fermentalgiana]|uniref:Uncharacterized protein n=1 Tax=Hondaea fermentalgiana TaxID=2315210 RepID=A0A2R5G2J1_9STRA|nr:Hypothetical Protein FCC1311_014292 [Hondaea fermentalgiana]|eukprot:GBG25212.1 Hypothetical Protein FCC1311_014292 [Hondaea fermentalgiana]